MIWSKTAAVKGSNSAMSAARNTEAVSSTVRQETLSPLRLLGEEDRGDYCCMKRKLFNEVARLTLLRPPGEGVFNSRRLHRAAQDSTSCWLAHRWAPTRGHTRHSPTVLSSAAPQETRQLLPRLTSPVS